MRACRNRKLLIILIALSSALIIYLTIKNYHLLQKSKVESKRLSDKNTQETTKEDSLNRFSRLIFVGGSLRSGTTLMRTMIESHSDIKCGPETGVFPEMLQEMGLLYRERSKSGLSEIYNPKNNNTLSLLEESFANFILNIIHELNKPSKYYCNKDPLNLQHISSLVKLFPNSKIVLMVRDFRAITQSFAEIANAEGRSLNYRDSVIYLNKLYEEMVTQCNAAKNCIIQQYEQLVLQPIKETQKIFKFFDIPWTEEVLRHDKHLDEIKLDPYEFATEQVKKPLYLDGLTKWFGKIPHHVVKDLPNLAPMMTNLGYDVTQAEPNYGKADDFVMKRAYHPNIADILIK